MDNNERERAYWAFLNNVKTVYNKGNTVGADLHVILDDDNCSLRTIKWCRKYMKSDKRGDYIEEVRQAERDILDFLETVSIGRRRTLVRLAYDYANPVYTRTFPILQTKAGLQAEIDRVTKELNGEIESVENTEQGCGT